MEIKLIDVLENLAVEGQEIVKKHNKIPGGKNGPYNDLETPVRNSSHWIMIFSKIYKLSKQKKYLDSIYKLAEYIISNEARPYGYSFFHRNKKRKDKCNGLIGQAWTFESLIKASEILQDEKYSKIAIEVFNQHPFNEKYGLWNRVEIDGNIFSFDGTFNHQLWFASSASSIIENNDKIIEQKINIFLNYVKNNLTTMNDGLIFHQIKWIWRRRLLRSYLFNAIAKSTYKNIELLLREGKLSFKYTKISDFEKERIKKEIYRSVGYHCFNLYAFAILKNNFPEHKLWQNPILDKTLRYIFTDKYFIDIEHNKYGFPYNAPGFEIPFILFTFFKNNHKDYQKQIEKWLNIQFKKSYNIEKNWFSNNNPDPLTLTSRFYEITRLPDNIFNEININI
jgi:hypothetical protein